MAINEDAPRDWDAGLAELLDAGQKTSASHFDIPLDEEPQPGGMPVALPDLDTGTRRQVIPNVFRSWQALRAETVRTLGRWGHIAAFHLFRSPWYGIKATGYAVLGIPAVIGRQLAWWWVNEARTLEQAAANAEDGKMWATIHREGKNTRFFRFLVLAAEAAALAVGGYMLPAAPWWAWVATFAAGVAVLRHFGQPADRRIVSPAVVGGRFRKLNPDIVLRAYYAAGLGHPDKPGMQIQFGSTMARDTSGTGSQVLIDLPYGKTFDDAVKARGAIASGLDVSPNQVYITRDVTSHRRHVLFVADRDPLAIPAGRTPLLDGKVRDIWTPAPFGLDERGRKVGLLLMWISVLIGAQPRKGKTFSARALALYAALDPYVKLLVVDGKMSADWDKFRLVAHRWVCGVVPNSRDDDPVTHVLDMLREVKKHIETVNDLLAKLPVTECPEGKITRELSRKYEQLRVWVLVMEEFQNYFETDDQETNKEIAALLSFIKAVGPSAGVVMISASQKPSGVGAGDVSRLFNRFRDNHDVRFALKCGNRIVSEAILGGDAYAEGFDASTLPTGDNYRGVGILYGASDDTPIVRTYLADHNDAEKILTAARKHRVAAGTLSGYAAGEHIARDVRDVLADAVAMFHPGENGLSWQRLADRLAERLPEHYADITAETISAQLRALGVPSVNIKEDGRAPKGARLVDIQTAISRRDR
jgi:DNA segregation ATPase FtsK/SpoIIIE, S-DNA-T family